MLGRFYTSLLILVAAGLMSVSALAAINRPSGQHGKTYEQCSVECTEFADAQTCIEFRKAHLICTEKKKSTWPIFTAQVLEEVER